MATLLDANIVNKKLLFEEVRNERNIARVRIVLLAIILIAVSIARFTANPTDPLILLRFYVVISFCLGYLILSIHVRRYHLTDHYFPKLKYILTTLDILLITIAAEIIRHTSGPSTFIMSSDTPAFFALFFQNALSGLRLSVRHSWYTAMVSCAVYLALTISDFYRMDAVDPTLVLSAVIKGVFLVATALVSGYIGYRAKKLIIHDLVEHEEKDRITRVLGRYVSGPVADKILGGDVDLGGEEREIVVFFSDIRDFTWISEKLTPHKVVSLLNEYFEEMVTIVYKNDGVVNKFIGDGIMAIFGAPVAHENDQERAVLSAIEMRERLKEFNRRQIRKEDVITLAIAIGISTGVAVVGNIGSKERMEYTAIGDTVNTASRIVDVAKERNSDILVDEATYLKIKDRFITEKLEAAKVKGKDEPVPIYRIVSIA